jgi:hypothetical protein
MQGFRSALQRHARFAAAVLVLTIPALTMAAPPPLSPQEFESRRAQIEHDLGDGKTYAEILPAEREEVLAALHRISTSLSGVDDVSKLSVDQQAQVFNDQEFVNTTLTRAAKDSRMVCERDISTGSHMATMQCSTVAERRRTTDEAGQALRRVQNKPRGIKATDD